MGRKELFEGLYLEKHWDWSKKYPVIHIDFGGRNLANESVEFLKDWIVEQLKQTQTYFHVSVSEYINYASLFEKLIRELYKTYNSQVVVLIDEYDKPILDLLENKEEAIKVRETLKNFYGVLKPLDAYLKFVFITGVSKFSKVSLFSGLNHLQDITLDKRYATICGYTQNELVNVFQEELVNENLEEIAEWYNGYSFLGESVYNPFDILLYLAKREFHPFWFETGTPTFLIKLLVEKRFYLPNMEELLTSENLIGSFDIDFIEPENLLFQTGYLTIKKRERTAIGYTYYLTYPNKEVKVSLNRYVTNYITQTSHENIRLNMELYQSLRESRLEEVKKILNSLFASIPYEWYRKNEIASFEGYYASVVYSFLTGGGFDVKGEDYTNRGRIDLSILLEGRCFILEFSKESKSILYGMKDIRAC